MKHLLITFLMLSSIAVFGQRSAEDLNATGDEYWEKGNYEKAIEYYTRALNLSKQALFYFNRAYCHEYLNNNEEALNDYTRAIKLEPDYAEAYNARGFLKDNQGKFEEAIADYTKAINADSRLVDAYNNRGFARNQIKEYELAVKDFTNAIKYNGTFAAAYNNRGSARHELGEYELAIKDFTKAISLETDEADFYDNRGTAKYHLEEYTSAIEDYNTALRIDPNSINAYYNRGSAREKLDMNEEAIADFQKVLAFSPGNQAATMKIDNIQYKVKRAATFGKITKEYYKGSAENKGRIANGVELLWDKADFEKYNGQKTALKKITLEFGAVTEKTQLMERDFILYVNGKITECDATFVRLGKILSVNVCLETGTNEIYVEFDDASTAMLVVILE